MPPISVLPMTDLLVKVKYFMTHPHDDIGFSELQAQLGLYRKPTVKVGGQFVKDLLDFHPEPVEASPGVPSSLESLKELFNKMMTVNRSYICCFMPTYHVYLILFSFDLFVNACRRCFKIQIEILFFLVCPRMHVVCI